MRKKARLPSVRYVLTHLRPSASLTPCPAGLLLGRSRGVARSLRWRRVRQSVSHVLPLLLSLIPSFSSHVLSVPFIVSAARIASVCVSTPTLAPLAFLTPILSIGCGKKASTFNRDPPPVPEGDWYCKFCRGRTPSADNAKVRCCCCLTFVCVCCTHLV